MKKNHINFAHPNKWSDSLASQVELPSVQTEIATGQRTKNKICKNRVWSRHHTLFWKTKEKPKKIKQGMRKTRFWVRESITCGEDISTL